jgi:hypothetical protein
MLLIKAINICDHLSTDPSGFILSFYASIIVSVHGPPQLLYFDFDANPLPRMIQILADPDPLHCN